jgi:hypothetical protein
MKLTVLKGERQKERRSSPTTPAPVSLDRDSGSSIIDSGIDVSNILPTSETRLGTTDLGVSGIPSSTISPCLLQHPTLPDVQMVGDPQNSDLGSGDSFEFDSDWGQHDNLFQPEVASRDTSSTPHQQPVQIGTHALQDNSLPPPHVCIPKVLVREIQPLTVIKAQSGLDIDLSHHLIVQTPSQLKEGIDFESLSNAIQTFSQIQKLYDDARASGLVRTYRH